MRMILLTRVLFLSIVLSGSGAVAQFPPEEPANGPPPAPGIQPPREFRGPEAWPARGPLWRGMWLDREGKTTDPLGLRAGFLEELRHVPTLEKHIREFIAIQIERTKLERERQEIAHNTDRPPAEQLAKFHQVLNREDELNTRSVSLLSRLRADRRAIEQEIKTRLEQLEELRSSQERKEEKPRPGRDAQMPRRWQRFYAATLGQLDRLDEVGNAGEWFNGVTRNVWQQERSNEQALEGALRQLDRLQREQEELRRRLENVQNQLDDLSELLSSLRPKRSTSGEQRLPDSPDARKLQPPFGPKNAQQRLIPQRDLKAPAEDR